MTSLTHSLEEYNCYLTMFGKGNTVYLLEMVILPLTVIRNVSGRIRNLISRERKQANDGTSIFQVSRKPSS